MRQMRNCQIHSVVVPRSPDSITNAASVREYPSPKAMWPLRDSVVIGRASSGSKSVANAATVASQEGDDHASNDATGASSGVLGTAARAGMGIQTQGSTRTHGEYPHRRLSC